jgi:glycogen(starch) synthase
MRILVLSNFYPPHFIGGYELGCRDVVDGLKQLGHDVNVLTSTHGLKTAKQSDGIYRWLESDLGLSLDGSSADLFKILKKESENQRAFARVCREFAPEVLYVWNATHISISLALNAQRRGLQVCYFISDHWLSEWENDALYSLKFRSPRKLHRRLLWKSLLASLKISGLLPNECLDLANVHFASHYLKDEAIGARKAVSNAEVIYWGVDVNRFQPKKHDGKARRLLYVGQLTHHKGVHTAVQALKTIIADSRHRSTMLTIVGGPDYENRVHQFVDSLGLEQNIRFTGLVPRDHLPRIYEEHDILLFPSIWEEPFSLTLLEAMSSVLAVVGTDTGGTSEILKHEVNGLIFPKEDVSECARQVIRLLVDAELLEALGRQGRSTVEDYFRIDQMVDRIDAGLKKAVNLDS